MRDRVHVTTLLAAGCCLVAPLLAQPAGRVSPGGDVVNRDAAVMADFGRRVEEYVMLRDEIEGTLGALPKDATPAQIDAYQRRFGSRLGTARQGARQGDVLTPPMQDVVRRLVARLFVDRRARRQLRDSIMDDNPGARAVALRVNARYPDEVPLSTMPPEVLKNLPKLPPELEYRFVGDALILLDPDAHIVVDFVPGTLPR